VNRAEALEEAERPSRATEVYSNGSCINGKVGAAAVLFKQGEEVCVLRKHMGDECRHTVFEAEGVGITLAAELINRE